MVKNNNNKSNGHIFRGCREVFLVAAPRSGVTTSAFIQATDVTGSGSFAQVLCPLGLTSVVLSGGLFTAGTIGNVTGPPLRSLWNRAADFQMYRVTRAKFVFVPAVGTTTQGAITLSGFSDPLDVSTTGTYVFGAGSNTRTFPLAGGKEISVSVPVDSSWKKVSSLLTYPGNAYPLTATSASTFAVASTVSDLCFGSVLATVTGGTNTAPNLGSYWLDYDIEFKSPIDSAINL